MKYVEVLKYNQYKKINFTQLDGKLYFIVAYHSKFHCVREYYILRIDYSELEICNWHILHYNTTMTNNFNTS